VTARTPPGGGRRLAERVKTAKGRPIGSTQWLRRQLADPYVAAAQSQGYRSRAAFKLSEIDDKHHLLKPGARVLDLGAAPGGWSQVAAGRAGEGGRVLAVDILEMPAIPGVTAMQLDFTQDDAPAKVSAALDGPADVVLSDMAPPTTGHRETDQLRSLMLAELALDFALTALRPGGAFLVKVLQGQGEPGFFQTVRAAFATALRVKPAASRPESKEVYVLGLGRRRSQP